MAPRLKYTFSFLFILLFVGSISAQKKVKYKHLYPLLQVKDYQNAEKDLLSYLAETDDEANPYYYLGEIVSLKLDSTKIFPTSNTYDSLLKVAIEAYKKSISLIDEKEVRKNDEYYLAYNRRDLRTGKFGIKISDVHLDYENKVKVLENQQQIISDSYLLKQQVDESYAVLYDKLAVLKEQYPTEEAFLLQLRKEDIRLIDEISTSFELFESHLLAYQIKVNSLAHPFHEVRLEKEGVKNWSSILTFKKEVAFDSISYPDYLSFIQKKKELLLNTIFPAKELLIKTNKALDKAILSNRIANDSVGIQNISIPIAINKDLGEFETFKIADTISRYKQLKANISILENPKLFPILNDTLNIYQRVKFLDKLYNKYQELNALLLQIQISPAVEQNMAFYFQEFEPSIEVWLQNEKAHNKDCMEIFKSINDSLAIKTSYIVLGKDSVWFLNEKALDVKRNIIQFSEERADYIIVAGSLLKNTFVAKLTYDMEVLSYVKIDSTDQIMNIEFIKDDLLVDVASTDSLSNVHYIVYLDSQANVKWKYKHLKQDTMHAVKMEAGIIFIYDEDNKAYLTFNQNGKAIGGQTY